MGSYYWLIWEPVNFQSVDNYDRLTHENVTALIAAS